MIEGGLSAGRIQRAHCIDRTFDGLPGHKPAGTEAEAVSASHAAHGLAFGEGLKQGSE
ncbi:hypothetical protein D3C74_259760 [compost metagenome]